MPLTKTKLRKGRGCEGGGGIFIPDGVICEGLSVEVALNRTRRKLGAKPCTDAMKETPRQAEKRASAKGLWWEGAQPASETAKKPVWLNGV